MTIIIIIIIIMQRLTRHVSSLAENNDVGGDDNKWPE